MRTIISRLALTLLVVSLGLLPTTGHAQGEAPLLPARSALSLEAALDRARRASPLLAAARADLAAADGRVRQAGALANPTLSWQYERTSAGGLRNAQHITTLEQPIAVGVRAARIRSAELRRRLAAEALRAVELDLALTVTRAYARAIAADRHVVLGEAAQAAFDRATRISAERRAAGDISAYADRRIRIEAARYAALLAQARMTQRATRRELAALVAPEAAPHAIDSLPLQMERGPTLTLSADSAVAIGLAMHPDLRSATLALEAAEADSRLVLVERRPAPTLIAGLKTEQASGLGGLDGIAAGMSLPLPVLDRRAGMIDAARAGSARATADLTQQRMRTRVEILDALDGVRAIDAQLMMLAPSLGDEATRALRAAEAAYAEGEIALLDWLDAVRSVHEAESAFALVQSESLIRRAQLARALGLPSLP
ncbi:MAG: TolC family protein [Gemmatimonadota bacterium]|nr:TolC family protein [Gemmatimonadota bacterium]MDQ8152903.1 TolC family protein [Gemmatimonadota bacterium]